MFDHLNIWWIADVQLANPQDEVTSLSLRRISAQSKTAIKEARFNFVLVKGATKRAKVEGIVGEQ